MGFFHRLQSHTRAIHLQQQAGRGNESDSLSMQPSPHRRLIPRTVSLMCFTIVQMIP